MKKITVVVLITLILYSGVEQKSSNIEVEGKIEANLVEYLVQTGTMRHEIITVSDAEIRNNEEMEEYKISHGYNHIEPNYKLQLDEIIINDPSNSLQWSLNTINIYQTWNTTLGSRTIKVAVIDSGIDIDHPDLQANYITGGYDWYNDDNNPTDDNGHGTHVAGIIAAEINNSIGISGMANVSIFAEKIFGSDGSSLTSYAIDAIYHAVDAGADIITNSWGGPEYSRLLAEAIQYAISQGVMVISSTGNEGVDSEYYPAGYPGVIGVGSIGQSKLKSSFSNYGDNVDLVAPGENIYSTTINSYGYKSGTSMAVPHVTGMAALLWSYYQDYSDKDITNLLFKSAEDLGVNGIDSYYGYGMIDGAKSIEGLSENDVSLRVINNPSSAMLYTDNTVSIEVSNLGTASAENVTTSIFMDNELYEQQIDNLARSEKILIETVWTPATLTDHNITITSEYELDEDHSDNRIELILPGTINTNYEVEDISPSWMDAKSNGININLAGDDVSKQVAIGFSFRMYDTNFTSVHISSNGRLSFQLASITDFNPQELPNKHFPYSIALFWYDLQAENNIYVWQTEDVFVIEFNDYRYVNGQTAGTFELILNRDGTIQFQYKSVPLIKDGLISGLNHGSDTHLFIESIAGSNIKFKQKELFHNIESTLQSSPIDTSTTEVIVSMVIANKGLYDENGISVELILDGVTVQTENIISLAIGLETQYSYIIEDFQANKIYDILLNVTSNEISETKSQQLLLDTIDPEINHPEDNKIDEGSSVEIIWQPSDDRGSGNYTITMNGTIIEQGHWNSSDEIKLQSPNKTGVYNYNITIYDMQGNWVSDEVRITIIKSETTTSSVTDEIITALDVVMLSVFIIGIIYKKRYH